MAIEEQLQTELNHYYNTLYEFKTILQVFGVPRVLADLRKINLDKSVIENLEHFQSQIPMLCR